MSPTLRDADDSGTHGLKDYTDVCKTTTESERDYNGGGSENVPGPSAARTLKSVSGGGFLVHGICFAIYKYT